MQPIHLEGFVGCEGAAQLEEGGIPELHRRSPLSPVPLPQGLEACVTLCNERLNEKLAARGGAQRSVTQCTPFDVLLVGCTSCGIA